MQSVIALILLLVMQMGLYAEESEKQLIIFPAGAVHQGDYFAYGGVVEISGTITGDLYVLAKEALIDGRILGDVLIMGGNVDIIGHVGNNVRAVGGQVTITGNVAHNVTIVAGNISVANSAVIDGNVVAVGGNCELSGPIGGDVTAISSSVRVSSTIGKNLSAHVGQLRLTSRADVVGSVDYTSNSKAWIDPSARIGGALHQHLSVLDKVTKPRWAQGILIGSKVTALLMNFLYTFVVGIVLMRLFPHWVEGALAELHTRPLRSFWRGLLLIVILPLASLILMMTILGIPFALTLIALNVLGFYTAKIYPILWVSNTLFPKIGLKPGKLFTLFIGLILYFVLTAIPFVGWLIAFCTMLLGLGAGIRVSRQGSFWKKRFSP